jgi:hypothetical protein
MGKQNGFKIRIQNSVECFQVSVRVIMTIIIIIIIIVIIIIIIIITSFMQGIHTYTPNKPCFLGTQRRSYSAHTANGA